MKSTKRSLFLSAMALLLCTSMLIGTTYAWFTESVSSVNNIITGGNLDVELEWWNATDKEWQPVTKDTNVFMEDTYWEPGHTEVVYLRVSNKGDLSLKYQLGVNVADEVHGTNVDGKDFLLSEKIYFDAIETATEVKYENRAEALAAVQVETQIKEGYSTASKLYPAATPAVAGQPSEEYVTLVVYMPETVGNEANHNGIQVPSITLGINLIASQFTWENDSFDEYYDAAAPWAGGIDTTWYDPAETEYTINSAEALAGFAAIVNGTAEPDAVPYGATATTIQDTFEGKTVKLAADLDLNNIPWTPIGTFKYDRDAQKYADIVAFKGTFNGQGHTIYNLKINTPDVEGAGLFASVEAATIVNLTMNNVDIVAGSHAGAIVGRAHTYGKLTTITNCHVTGKISILIDWAYAGAIIGKANTLNIAECSVMPTGTGVITAANRNAVGSLVGWVEQPSNFVNCKATDMHLTGWANIGGITGYICSGSTIEDCSATNMVLTKTRQDGHPTIGYIAGGYSGQNMTIKNSVAKNISLNGTAVAVMNADTMYGAEFSGNVNAIGPVVSGIVSDELVNNLIYVTEVKTVDDLKNALITSGKYVLKADLSLTEIITIPIGKDVTLYLNGKTITGTDTITDSFGLITNKGNLTINGEGKITLTATTDRDWNAYSSVISNNPGGKLTVNGGTIEHLGGTDMAYGIDNLTNGKNTYAETVINGGTVKSTYRAIRMFLNGIEAENILTVNGGIIEGTNKSIWMQDPNANANTGKLTVSKKASLKGNVYLYVTADSTEWPVEVDIATKALSGESTVVSGNVPAGYVVLNDGTKWYVKSSEVVSENISDLGTNNDVYLKDGEYTMPGVSNSDVTISGTKDTVISVSTPAFHGSNVTLNGVTIKANGGYVGIQHVKTVTYNDVTIDGSMMLYGDKVVFNNCTFNLVGDYIWTYGAKEVEFNNCTFNTTGKAILIYNEGAGASKVTVKGCTFNATAGAKAGAIANQNCAAIEIDNFQNNGMPGTGHTLITEGNTYSSNFSGEWRIKNYQIGDAVTVNGTEYTQIAVDGKLMTIDASKNVTVLG